MNAKKQSLQSQIQWAPDSKPDMLERGLILTLILLFFAVLAVNETHYLRGFEQAAHAEIPAATLYAAE